MMMMPMMLMNPSPRCLTSSVITNARRLSRAKNPVHYVQGQVVSGVREYFYYVDHQGMLYLDDARMKNFTSCFKELHFLRFFFKRLKLNKLNRYKESFPFVSMCQNELNFVRAEDTPIVFTAVLEESESLLTYNHAHTLLATPFMPDQLFTCEQTGRLYHPGPLSVGGVGLVADKLAMVWTEEQRFVFDEEQRPTHFVWQERRFSFNNALKSKLEALHT